MRKLLLFLVLFSLPVQAQVVVSTTAPVDGKLVIAARTTSEGSYCRAPLGVLTYFKLDHGGRLFIVQPGLNRSAELNSASIGAYRDAREMALHRVAENNRALIESSAVDPKIKAALARNTDAPNPPLTVPLLQAQSTPEKSARTNPQLVALDQALVAARGDIEKAGLRDTILGGITTCIIDVTHLPVLVADPSTGARLTLSERPAASKIDALDGSFETISLYELLENFGVPPPKEPGR
ncbi:hypothetical protein [Mesorhizobium sp. M0977]|uniref:hypothetical protein n=1 Tax=Mesorhizobium sp. M0977 TaxID=2957039 RepID=UPI003338C0E1